ncbi:MAG: hypothetical protein IPM56_10685 [Ignavibacteriales bacterium]|nr:MAG: hypothetical protein IPM56_10685 [Ignavibacteriales bacterium]
MIEWMPDLACRQTGTRYQMPDTGYRIPDAGKQNVILSFNGVEVCPIADEHNMISFLLRPKL